MSTRSDAQQWLKSHYGKVTGPVYTSKYYKAEESWTRSPVWFLQVPVRHLTSSKAPYINLLCQVAPEGHSYHYLKVPAGYFIKQFDKLGFTTDTMVNLHLSAEATNMFEDERGKGKVDFSSFLVMDK